nr:MAG TPA_asm: hypothetical protein [Caudoviricetes sp.]
MGKRLAEKERYEELANVLRDSTVRLNTLSYKAGMDLMTVKERLESGVAVCDEVIKACNVIKQELLECEQNGI